VYQRRVRARLSPPRAAEIRAENAEAHRDAYIHATTEQHNDRITAQRARRAQVLADLPFLSQFESDPNAACAKFGDSSGATLFSARAAAAGVSVRDYVLEDDAMGPVSTMVQQDCMKAFLTVTDALVKMCAVCGQQLIDVSSFRCIRPCFQSTLVLQSLPSATRAHRQRLLLGLCKSALQGVSRLQSAVSGGDALRPGSSLGQISLA